jgi:di/tricarboxylate transporter
MPRLGTALRARCGNVPVTNLTFQIALSLTILAAMVALLASHKWPPDVVSLLAMLATMLAGLLTPAEAFASFANPVVITIASILVVSTALFQTGVASRLGRVIVTLAGDNEPRLLAALMVGAALLSAVMNNVAAVAVMIPVVLDISLHTRRAPSRLLLPVAYACVIGGTLTLIGSPPNLIASQILAGAGHEPLALLDITSIGVLNTLSATVFMITLGRQLLPGRLLEDRLRQAQLPRELIDLYRVPERIFALEVTLQSPLVGQTLGESGLGHDYGLTVLGVMRGTEWHMSPSPAYHFQAGDRLLTQGGPNHAKWAAEDKRLLWQPARVEGMDLMTGDVGVAEVTLVPRSCLAGRTIRELHFREQFGLTVLALWRAGEPVECSIGDEPLRLGDAFLVIGPWANIRLLRRQPGLMLVSEHEEVPRRTQRAPWAISIAAAMLAVVVTGWLPLPVASLAAATLTVLTGCLDSQEARNAVDWQTVILIAGTLTVAAAMERTQATQWITHALFAPLAGQGSAVFTAVLLVGTALLTLGISNYAAAALVAPVALSTALSYGLDPKTQLLAVAVGTTAALFSPMPHPGLMLVMGPGNYRFRDYLRVGLPLGLLVLLVTWIGLTLL